MSRNDDEDRTVKTRGDRDGATKLLGPRTEAGKLRKTAVGAVVTRTSNQHPSKTRTAHIRRVGRESPEGTAQ
jgi:hypothetical protein